MPESPCPRPKTGYALEFGPSTSSAFAAAVRQARTVPGATVRRGAGGERWRVPLGAAPLAALCELVQRVGSWRQTAVTLDGVVLPRPASVQLEAVLGCAQERALGGAGLWHCWGLTHGLRRRLPCRFVEGLLPPTPDGTPTAVWLQVIDAAARCKCVAACPAYDPVAMAAAVRAWAAGEDPLGGGAPERIQLQRLLRDVDLGDG